MAHNVDKSETLSGSLTDIRAFCHVVELGTLSAAARVLNETKGSLSRRISRLEQQLALQLLARHPRSVSVTSEGLLFYNKAREGLLLLEEGAEQAKASRTEPRGLLRITAPLDMALEWLPERLARFAHLYPHIRLELLTTDQPLDLTSHQIDVALRATRGGLPDMGYTGRSLGILRMGWFATPAYLSQHAGPVHPESLHQHPLILCTESLQAVNVDLKQGRQQECLTLHPRFCCSDYASNLRLTLSGLGIGLFPYLIAERSLQQGLLQSLLEDWQGPQGELFLITLSGPRAPARVQAFKEFILQEPLR